MVTRLEYEAYVPMAEKEILKILAAARKKWPSLLNICVLHRTGEVSTNDLLDACCRLDSRDLGES